MPKRKNFSEQLIFIIENVEKGSTDAKISLDSKSLE